MAACPCGARGSGLKAFSRWTSTAPSEPARHNLRCARQPCYLVLLGATWAPLVLLGHRGRPRQDTATQVARSPSGRHFSETKWLRLPPILTNHLHFLSETGHSSKPFCCFAFQTSCTQNLPTSSAMTERKQIIAIFVLLSCVMACFCRSSVAFGPNWINSQ